MAVVSVPHYLCLQVLELQDGEGKGDYDNSGLNEARTCPSSGKKLCQCYSRQAIVDSKIYLFFAQFLVFFYK